MSSLGQTLRQAREARGLTQSQVASQTRILIQIIDDIENEDFHRIAAPIYGRGFVRLYAECVGLEAQPLIREFMDIYEGRRAPTVLVREIPTEEQQAAPEPPPPEESPDVPQDVFTASPTDFLQPEDARPPIQTPFAPSVDSTPPPPPPPPPEPEHLWDPPETVPPVEVPAPTVAEAPEEIPAPPPVVRGLDLFDQAAGGLPVAPEPSSAHIPETASDDPTKVEASPFLPPIYEDNGPSAADRFKSGISSVSHGVLRSVRRIPRSAWRKTLLASICAAMLAVLVFGCMKLYQMTAPAKDPCENGACEYNPRAQTPQKPQPAKATPSQATAKSTPQAQPRTASAKTSAATATPPKASGKIHSTGQKIAPLYVD